MYTESNEIADMEEGNMKLEKTIIDNYKRNLINAIDSEMITTEEGINAYCEGYIDIIKLLIKDVDFKILKELYDISFDIGRYYLM